MKFRDLSSTQKRHRVVGMLLLFATVVFAILNIVWIVFLHTAIAEPIETINGTKFPVFSYWKDALLQDVEPFNYSYSYSDHEQGLLYFVVLPNYLHFSSSKDVSFTDATERASYRITESFLGEKRYKFSCYVNFIEKEMHMSVEHNFILNNDGTLAAEYPEEEVALFLANKDNLSKLRDAAQNMWD